MASRWGDALVSMEIAASLRLVSPVTNYSEDKECVTALTLSLRGCCGVLDLLSL